MAAGRSFGRTVLAVAAEQAAAAEVPRSLRPKSHLLEAQTQVGAVGPGLTILRMELRQTTQGAPSGLARPAALGSSLCATRWM